MTILIDVKIAHVLTVGHLCWHHLEPPLRSWEQCCHCHGFSQATVETKLGTSKVNIFWAPKKSQKPLFWGSMWNRRDAAASTMIQRVVHTPCVIIDSFPRRFKGVATIWLGSRLSLMASLSKPAAWWFEAPEYDHPPQLPRGNGTAYLSWALPPKNFSHWKPIVLESHQETSHHIHSSAWSRTVAGVYSSFSMKPTL